MEMDTTIWAQDTYSTSTGSYPQPLLTLPPNWQVGAPFSHQHLYPPQFLPSNRVAQYAPQQLGRQLMLPQLVPQQLGEQLNGPGQHSGLSHQYAAAQTRGPSGQLISPLLAPQQLSGQLDRQHIRMGPQYAPSQNVALSPPGSSQSLQGSPQRQRKGARTAGHCDVMSAQQQRGPRRPRQPDDEHRQLASLAPKPNSISSLRRSRSSLRRPRGLPNCQRSASPNSWASGWDSTHVARRRGTAIKPILQPT